MTYSIAYIVDQAFFSVAYLIVAVLFLLQLLVERKAKYDAKVLNARQRLDDWHADRGGNNRGSAMVSPRGSSSMPKSARRASAGPVSQDDDSTSVSRLEGSKGSVTDQTSHNGSHEKKQRRLRVGLLQWSFHRLGLIMALIMCWREVDPYGVHGLFSFVHVQFLSLNAQALLYICALIAFFYPIHLVRVVAFHARTRVLEVLGGSLSILTLAIANITPGLYSRYGIVNGIRALTSIWFGITLLIACIVFNIYMFRLVISIRKLTDEDGWKQEANTEMAPPEKKQNSTYQAEHSTSKRASSPLMPILDFNANGTAGGLTIAPSTTASRTPSRKNSLTGYNTGGSQVNLLRSSSPTADLLPPVGDQTTDDEYGGSHLITPARLPSSNDETLDSSDQSNKPSPRGPNAFPTLSPHAHPSLSAPTTPSHSQRNLTAVNQQHLGTSSVVVEVNEHPTSASTPASPTFAAQTAAPNPPGSALNSARVVASAKADIRKKPSSPYARQYNEMLRKMQKFQVLATIIVVIVCIAITYSGMQQAAKFHEEFDVPKADDYMSAILIALFVLIVLVGEVIIFWYAYMPISILWTDVLRKPRAREAASPVANANGNSASAISAV